MQQWRSPRNSLEMVSFAALARPDTKPTVMHPEAKEAGTVQLCGGLTGTLLHLQMPSGAIGDAVYLQWHDMRATATYFYPKGLSPDPQAEAAIRSICPQDEASH